MTEQTEGTLEKPEDAGKGEAGEVARWRLEIDLAGKTESKFRDKGQKVFDRYRMEGERKANEFNILYSNVEVMRPMLYGQTPKADVRQRQKKKDPVGAAAAEVMEQALEYEIDSYDFDHVLSLAVLDYLLPGRAVCRVRFEPSVENQSQENERLAYARTYCERVAWERFRRGPGQVWDEVPWIAYEHQLTREEVDKQFPGMGAKVKYDITMAGVDEKKADSEPTVFKRVRVWEIWDKVKKQILYYAPSYKEAFLKREDDKLNLEGFFDCERPFYAIDGGLTPQPEFETYRQQAEELDKVNARINKLVGTLKQRGIYDRTMTELEKLLEAGDNEMVPVGNGAAVMAAGGMDKAVWMLPIDQAVKALQQLVIHREQVKQTIYEIMGIGDILRGASDPGETLGAQQLKAQTGSMRMQRRQRDVQRFVKGLLRKKAEIIAENYTPELLRLMTGVELPFEADKIAAQQQLAMMQQQQAMQPDGAPEIPTEIQQLLSSPTWEEVMKVLKSDLLRGFRIDIETDSTVAADQTAEREQVTELVTGIGGFAQNMVPAVEGGLISAKAAKAILVASARRFKLGRKVEDALEEDQDAPQQQGPTPEQMAVQAEQQKAQAELQMKQQEMQLKQQDTQANLALKQQEAQTAFQTKQQEMALKQQEAEAKVQIEMQKLAFEREKFAFEQQKAEFELRLQADQAEMARTQATESHQLEREKMGVQVQLKSAELGDASAARAETRDHEIGVKKMVQPDDYEAEMKEIADAMRQLAESIAQTHQDGQEHAARHTELMAKAVTLMAAPSVAVRDGQGRIVGSRKELRDDPA